MVAATPSQDEAAFLQKLNQERVNGGLTALQDDRELAATSRSWSSHMAGQNALSHDPNLAQVAESVEPDWRSVGENVGVGYSVQSLHDAFMGSSGHRANIMKATYNRVGIGVVHSGGKIWVTVRFLQGPALSTSAGTTTVPGVRTSLAGDFDGDGHDDLLTYGPGGEADELWFGEADQTMRRGTARINGHYRPLAGDFDGDGFTDILWYAPGRAGDYVWEWDGSGFSSRPTTINGTYTPLSGDFDGDGVGDILWYAPGSAGDYYWYGNRSGAFTSIPTRINGTYRPIVGDLDGNAGDDLFWYAPGTAGDYMWYSTLRRGGYDSRPTRVNGTYQPFAGDFDGNGTDDLFWYAPGASGDYLWYTDGVRGRYESVARRVSGSYVPAAGDFDDNGADDVVWFSPTSASGDPLWFGLVESRAYTASIVRS